MSKKSQRVAPEESASQLLSELREENRRARENLSDYKDAMRKLSEGTVKLQAMLEDIQHGAVARRIEWTVQEGLVVYRKELEESVESARDHVLDQLKRLISMVAGIPPKDVAGSDAFLQQMGFQFDIHPSAASARRRS